MIFYNTILKGKNLDYACKKVGIVKPTYYVWVRKGRDAKKRLRKGETLNKSDLSYLGFYKVIQEAKSKRKKLELKRIKGGD